MGSYVISVSLGTGCYRHIQISKNATLYKLHGAILDAFEFIDDHAHAFFMDNKTWSQADAYYSMKMDGNERLTKEHKLEKMNLAKGSQFKYVFDFGEEWRFQCKVLRDLEEDTKTPIVLREVGEAPAQYGEPEWYSEGGDEDDDDDDLPDFLPQDVTQLLFETLPIPMKTVEHIHKYFEAGARLYGVIPVMKLLEIYNSQNEPVEENVFLALAEMIRHEKNLFFILGPEDYKEDAEPNPLSWDVVDNHLLLDNPEDYPKLVKAQGNKPYKILPKEEFLKYADHDYFPATPQNEAMRKYLFDRGDLPNPYDTWLGIQTMAEIDFELIDVINCCKSEGLVFNRRFDLGEFAALYQELNNHTRKQINRGHTPAELFDQIYRGMRRPVLENQLSLFDEPPIRPKLAIVGTPSRNDPCPCGSGKKYKNCCGK